MFFQISFWTFSNFVQPKVHFFGQVQVKTLFFLLSLVSFWNPLHPPKNEIDYNLFWLSEFPCLNWQRPFFGPHWYFVQHSQEISNHLINFQVNFQIFMANDRWKPYCVPGCHQSLSKSSCILGGWIFSLYTQKIPKLHPTPSFLFVTLREPLNQVFFYFTRKWMSQCKCTMEKLKNEPKRMQYTKNAFLIF